MFYDMSAFEWPHTYGTIQRLHHVSKRSINKLDKLRYLAQMSDVPSIEEQLIETESNAVFQLAYNGSDVSKGSMSVTELAPALMALNTLLETSNEVLNGQKTKIELRVLADFESGSFDINFLLHHVLVDTVAASLPTLGALTPKQILDATIGTYEKTKGIITGVTRVYKALKGEKPKEIRGGDNNTSITIIGDNNTVITDGTTAKLYSDERIRNAITRAAEPLARDGMDSMAIKRGNEVIETLQAGDIGSIELPVVTETANSQDDEKSREIWVRVVKPNFDGGRWTFHDGSAKFGADLEDKQFQARVNTQEQGFYQGDAFLIRLRSAQHFDKNGRIVTRNIVEKVLEQRNGPRQANLLP